MHLADARRRNLSFHGRGGVPVSADRSGSGGQFVGAVAAALALACATGCSSTTTLAHIKLVALDDSDAPGTSIGKVTGESCEVATYLGLRSHPSATIYRAIESARHDVESRNHRLRAIAGLTATEKSTSFLVSTTTCIRVTGEGRE
jgi:hypothetical protein